MRKCVKCGKEATVKIGGNDPDLNGVPACEDCNKRVHLAFFMWMNDIKGEKKDLEWYLKRVK